MFVAFLSLVTTYLALSQHLFQRDEYYNMLHPLPTQKIRRDYDPRTPGDLAQIKNVRMIDGDFDMGNGIRLFKVPGHSLGGMAIQVQTAEGKYVITGDMPHIAQSLFPQMDKMEVIGGEIVDISPATSSSVTATRCSTVTVCIRVCPAAVSP